MTDQSSGSMPPGWYPDETRPGYQRRWDGTQWVGVPTPIGKKGGFPKILIPVFACVGLAVVALIAGAIAGDPAEEETAATTEGPAPEDLAKCKDGTFSDNTDIRAICSSHDGIESWLADYGECEDGSVIALVNDPECPNGGDLSRLLPDYVPTAGPDDIALCNDGTFSDNRDLIDTCNSHDGVDEWLAEYGRCSGGDVIELVGDPRCPIGEDLEELLPDYSPPTTTSPPATTGPPATTAPATTAPTTTSPPTTTAPPGPTLSPSQQQAVRSAQDYLEFSGFSRQGLIDQLSSEYGDQFSVEDATVAVDSLNVDWNAEAAESAQDYLEVSAFSCQGLIDQLSSEYGDQFTVEQATYGANQTGIC